MSTWFRIFLFIAAFQLEVRVRASGVDAIQNPVGCLHGGGACIVRANSEAVHLSGKNLKFHLKAGSTLERRSGKVLRLVQGTVWFEEGQDVQVETLYGSVHSAEGAFWLIEEVDRVVVRNVESNLKLVLRDGREVTLPVGFEVWMGGINSQGKSSLGMVRPIDLQQHLQAWAPLYPGNLKSFRVEAKALSSRWADLGYQGGDLYQKVVERKLASIAEEKRQVQIQMERERAEKQRVRDLYFRKVFEQ